MSNFTVEGHTKHGTLGGIFTIIFLNINQSEIWKTIILAALGATVSYLVSMGWKFITRNMKKKKNI